MLKRFFDFLRDLFGGGSTEAQPAPAQAEPTVAEPPVAEPHTPPPPAQVHEEEAEAEAASAPAGVDIHLTLLRGASTPSGTPGTLSMDGKKLSDTLEGNGKAGKLEEMLIPEGTYTLGLLQEGGKHATYLYRFGETHHGLVSIKEAGLAYEPTLHIGYKTGHLYGSILVGNASEEQAEGASALRIRESEQTYLEIYPQLATAIAEGKQLALTIRS